MQLGSHVSNACTYISNASDVKAIMGLQDVWTDNTFNACKIGGYSVDTV
jgi:hypothetical protein